MIRQKRRAGPRRGAVWSCIIIVAVLTAGCSSPNQDQETDPQGPIPLDAGEVAGFTYPCPPEWDIQRTPDVCVGTLADVTQSYFWPHATAHPTEPTTLALAFARSPGGAESAQYTFQTPLLADIGLFVSQDGGANWEERWPPLSIPEVDSEMQPVIIHETMGLHIIGTETLVLGYVLGAGTQLSPSYSEFYLLASPDLGETWHEPVQVGDRVHYTPRGPSVQVEGDLVVVSYSQGAYFEPPGHHVVVWGEITERGWTEQGRHEAEGHIIPPIVQEGEALYLDSERSLSRLDLSSGQVEILSKAPQSGYLIAPEMETLTVWVTPLENQLDGELVLNWTMSHDGGANWSKPLELLLWDRSRDPSNHILHSWGSGVDGDGLLHLVFNENREEPYSGMPLLNEGREYVVRHFVVDLVRAELVHEDRLTPTDWLVDRRIPPPLGPDWAGANSAGTAGLALAGEHIFVAWGFDKGIDFTFATPQRAAGGNG